MHYLKSKAVRQKIHDAGKQITKDGLRTMDCKVEEYIYKLLRQWNGGKNKRITADLINLIKL